MCRGLQRKEWLHLREQVSSRVFPSRRVVILMLGFEKILIKGALMTSSYRALRVLDAVFWQAVTVLSFSPAQTLGCCADTSLRHSSTNWKA